MASTDKRGGLKIPTGILAPTTTRPDPEPAAEPAGPPRIAQDDPEPAEARAGGSDRDDASKGTPAAEKRTRKGRKRLQADSDSGAVEGRRLYLSEGVHFRLRIYAYQRGMKLSEAAEELLDKALPKWEMNRVG